MDISQRIFDKLQKTGITQQELSNATGIKKGTISSWKTGGYSPQSDKLDEICKFLGVSVQWLISGEEAENTMSDAQEQKLLNIFREISEDDKIILMARAIELKRSSEKMGSAQELRLAG